MIGRSIAHYRILERLGAGSMGEVYLAEDTRLERRVALKALPPAVADDPEHLERFRREARILAAAHHPSIVTVYSIEEHDGLHFFTMEHVDGPPLGELAHADLTATEVARWAIPLADALAAAHAAGIVHRDLKPSNVMMNARGELRVMDFGLAKRVDPAATDPSITSSGALVGTIAYMAPEQIRRARVDERTDLFAAGVLIYELATGRHPFDDGGDAVDVISAILHDRPAPPSAVRPELGGRLDAVVLRCLEKEPGDRYGSAAELRQALVEAARGAAEPPLGPPPREARSRRRNGTERPGIWGLPHLRNLNFSGRDDELERLSGLFAEARGPVPLAALVGLGGVGKTQLAIEYAHRHAADCRLVWWVPAEEPTALRSRYAELAAELGVAVDADVRRTAARVRDWLGANPGWLLVFDDAQDPYRLRPYLPSEGGGRVLVTSRNPAWRGVGQVLELGVWGDEQAAAFLERRTGQADPRAAGELNRGLAGLPLALEQAAAYIEASGQSLTSYTRLLQQQRLQLLLDAEPASPASSSSVFATWDLSLQQVARSSPAAAQLLDLCAFLAPDDIPLDLVTGARELLPAALAEAAADELALDQALTALLRYSLVSRQEDSVAVHRLVQAGVRRALGDDERSWAERALELVSRAFSSEGFRDVGVWPRCARLLPHAITCLGRLGDDPPAVAAELLDSVGSYLDGRGQYEEARPHLERALAIEERARGAGHPLVARRANSLGRLMFDLGRLEEARELFARALAIDEAARGPDHPRVAKRLNNLGAILMQQARWEEAEELLERALRIDEAAFGSVHPTISMHVTNLGVLHARRGDLARAKRCFERALRIDEEVFGLDHPRVASSVGNVGGICGDMGDPEAARPHHQRALAILEKSCGPDHPSLARHLRNLGEVLHALGRDQSARAHLDRALEIEQAAWGGSHPDQAETLELLGRLSLAQDRPQDARGCFESSLRILEEALGPEHPAAARVRARLEALGA